MPAASRFSPTPSTALATAVCPLTDARRTTAYADGQYIVTVALQDQSVSPGWAQFYTDMAFEVEATWQAVGSQSGVGLRFRVRDDHAYLFLIEADGFTLRRQLETETTLAEGISPFINQGVAEQPLGRGGRWKPHFCLCQRAPPERGNRSMHGPRARSCWRCDRRPGPSAVGVRQCNGVGLAAGCAANTNSRLFAQAAGRRGRLAFSDTFDLRQGCSH